MKQYLLTLLVPFTMCANATKETPIFEMECFWVSYPQKGIPQESQDSQTFSVYESNKTQILKITPTKNSTHIPPPTYTMKVKGAYSSQFGVSYYKEFYWMGLDTRLTLLRGDDTKIIIESISSPWIPTMEATCSNPIYSGNK
ncbi:hypothetical protein [Providencia rustigianii]|uniref:hypothetical protein n=1 Tax=Providencia rustigianii TaxID=158850 RepID=UPI0038B3C120